MKTNWFKRTLCSILVFVLVLGYVPVTAQAQDGQETSVSNNMTLEGTSSFGNLLTNTVNESQTPEADANYDGRICDLVIEDTTAVVEFTTPVDANLVVAIYDQDNGKMLGSGTVAVGPEETIAEVALKIPAMPRYFRAGAYLLDAATNDPVSEEFKTDHYTKVMQDILAATVDDFPEDLVLNLDDDKDTNFAVFNEKTLQAEAGVESNQISGGDGVYTITNADEAFLSMQPGETFTYTYPDGTMLIVNAASVRVNGTTVTVTENPDADLSTVFDFVKIEADSSGKKWEYDDSELGEGLTPVSGEGQQASSYGLPRGKVEGQMSFNQSFGVEQELKGKDGKDVVTIDGSLDFGLTLSLSIYCQEDYLSVSMKCDSEITFGFSISGSVVWEGASLGKLRVPLCPGVFGHVQPKLKVDASAELSGSVVLRSCLGFAYDNNTDNWANTSSPVKAELKGEFEGSVSIGVAMEVGVCPFYEGFANVEAELFIGAEVGSKDGDEPSEDSLHACEKCFAAELSGVGSLSAELSFCKKWTYTHDIFAAKIKILDFYYSVDSQSFGKGTCPNVAYRVTVQATLPSGEPYTGKPIDITKDGQPVTEVFLQDKDGKTKKAPVPLTNSQGESVFYLSPGDYTFQTEYEEKTAKSDATVKDKPVKVELEFVELMLSKTTLSLTEEENTATLTAALRGRDVTGKCTWKSSDENAVKVSGGKVEALAAGEATITAEYEADGEPYSAECAVTVTGKEHTFTLSRESMTLQDIGETGKLTAKLDGKTVTDKCEWTSSDETVATVVGGTVTAVAKGSATITAKYSYFGKDYEKTCEVSVRTDDGALTLSESSLSMKPSGATQTLTAEFDGQDVTDKCQWTSDSVSVATVSGGIVTPLNEGVATITATYEAYGETITGQCTVVVSEDTGTPDNPGGNTQTGSFGNLTWTYFEESRVLVISGTGAMPDYGSSLNRPWIGKRVDCIIIGNGVTRIGNYAFHGCGATNISIPRSVTSIGSYAFASNNQTGIVIPYGVQTIGDYAFSGCGNLTSVKMLNGITSIGENAFSQCEKLSSVTIPDSVRSIGEYAFFKCGSLTSITIPDGVTTIGESAFNQTGLTSISIPDSVTTIGDAAFFGSQLTSVEIPGSVTSFGQNAFGGCEKLTRVSFEEGITSIGSVAFQNCTNLTSVTIPDSVTTIGEYAFSWCGLTNVTLPKDLLTIAAGAFAGNSFESITIPGKVTSIGEFAFSDCQKLTSVTIPASVTTIEGAAFSDCNALKEIYYQGTWEQYCGITIWYGNDAFFQATIHCTDGDIMPSPLTEDSVYSLPPETEAPTEAPTEATTEATEVTVPDATEELLPEIIEEPKETEPAPQSEEELLLEEVSDIQWYSAPAGARMTVEPVLQKLSAFSGTESVRSGVRSVKFTGLEPGEEYALIVSLIPGSLVPQNLLYIDQDNAGPDGTLSFTYIPRQDVSTQVQLYGIPAGRKVTLNRAHLTMEVGADPVQLTARVTPEEWAGDIRWSAENPENTQVISVNASGDVTPIAPGIAYAVATVTHGQYTFSARCRVDVTEQSVAEMISGVQLGATAVTTELFRTDYAEFDVIIQLPQNMNPVMTSYALRSRSMVSNYGVAIDYAEFADKKTDSFFALIVKDDRTLRVVPRPNAIDNPKSVAGSFKSKVKVFVDGQEFVTDTDLKLSVKKSMPKLKVSALTFNPFYTGQSQAIRITGATVTNITFTENKTQPEWLDGEKLENGILTLTEDAPARASGRAYLTVDTAEWAVPTNLTVSVKTAYAAPKLKLSASTITLPTFANPDDNGYYAGGQWLRLLCAAKGDTLESLNVDKIEAPSGWYIEQGEDGWFWLQPIAGKQISAGKITLTLKVHFSNTDSVVPLTLTVKTKNTPIMIAPDYLHSVKLNSRIEDGFFLGNLTSNAWLNWEQYDLDLKILDEYGNNVVGSMFDVSDDLNYICTIPGTTCAGTYRMTLDLRRKSDGNLRTEKSSVVTITVLPASTKPSVSVKALDAIDYTFSDNPRTHLQLTFKNFQIRRIMQMYYSVTLGKNDMTDQFDLYFDDSVWSWVLKPKVEVPTGSYTLKLGACMDAQNPEEVTCSCSVKITVKRTPVKLKLSKTSLSLNKAIGDSAVVDVTCLTKGYDFKQPLAKLIPPNEKDGQNIHLNGPGSQEPLTVSWSGGKLTVTANTTAETGKTYKMVLKATEKDPAVTLSVGILDTAVTASLRAKGAIDVVRSSTSITVTPSYRNYMGLVDIHPQLTIESGNGKIYQPVEAGLFNIVQNDNGTFTITKAPRAKVDTTLKYRAMLTCDNCAKPAYVNLTVKSGTARIAVSGAPVLYKADRYSQGAFQLTTTDKTLNPIVRTEIRDEKYRNLFAIHSYGNGEFAIGFKDNLVPTGSFPSSVVLNVYADGDSSRSVASVTLKLQVR